MPSTNENEIPYLDTLWERDDGEWSWAMLVASVIVPSIPAVLLSGLIGTWPAAGFYLALVFWTGAAGTWRDTAGKGLYVTGVVFALLPILVAGSMMGDVSTAGGAAGTALGASLTLPIFVTLGAVAIGIGYYLRP